ncbi:MAK10-like protein [Tanacetum coccineum]
MGDENPIRTLGDYSKPSHEGYRNTIELPSEDPNQHLKDFLKLVDSLDLDGENRERTRLCLFQFSLRDQASKWLERLPAGSITTWEDLTTRFLAQFFPPRRTVKLRNDILVFQQHHGEYLSGAWTRFKDLLQKIPHHGIDLWLQNKEEEKDNPENIQVNPSTPPDPFVSFITKKFLKLNSFFESLGLVPQSSNTELVCTKGDEGEVMFIEIVQKNNDSRKEEPEAGEQKVESFDMLPTRSELAYHKYLMCGPIPSIFLKNLIITEGCPSNLKIPCNIGHEHVEKAYIDLISPLNIMNRMTYNYIMRRKLNPRENSDRGVSNFTGRIQGMHVFIGNFTYVIDFRIVEDISSIINPRLSQIEQYNSLSNLEKEHTKSVYLRNEEDKRRGVEYVMSKILGFYKECLELGPEYATGMDDEREVTKFLIKNEEEFFTVPGDGVGIKPDGVASPAM